MRDFGDIDLTASLGLVWVIQIAKGASAINFTTATNPLTIDGVTFIPAPGADITGIQFPSDGNPANVDVVVSSLTLALAANMVVSPGDGARGVLDGWAASLSMVDLSNPTEAVTILSGRVGSVDEDTRGIVTIAINGFLRLAQERPMCEHFALTGREDLGDDRCKIPILADRIIDAFDIGRGQDFLTKDGGDSGLIHVSDAYGRFRTGTTVEDYQNVYFECTTAGTTDASTAPSYNYTVGATTTDGTATFTARDAWTRHARATGIDPYNILLAALPDPRASDPTWFVNGGLFIRSGALNAFPKFPIRAWNPDTLMVTLFLPIDPTDIPANTQVEIHAGCDLTAAQCHARFDNIVNLRAETFVPQPELTLSL